MLGTIISSELNSDEVHSEILCRKCFKLIDDIDSLEGQVISKKQVGIFINFSNRFHNIILYL